MKYGTDASAPPRAPSRAKPYSGVRGQRPPRCLGEPVGHRAEAGESGAVDRVHGRALLEHGPLEAEILDPGRRRAEHADDGEGETEEAEHERRRQVRAGRASRTCAALRLGGEGAEPITITTPSTGSSVNTAQSARKPNFVAEVLQAHPDAGAGQRDDVLLGDAGERGGADQPDADQGDRRGAGSDGGT